MYILNRVSLPRIDAGRAILAIALLLIVTGCSEPESDLADLRNNPSQDDAGPYMVYGAMLTAAEYLGTPFQNVVDHISAVPEQVLVTDTASIDLRPGQFILRPEPSSEPKGFGPLEFQNTTSERMVLFLEPIAPGGESQGFTMVKLEAGDRFVLQHNAWPKLVKVGTVVKDVLTPVRVIGSLGVTLVIVVGGELRELYNSNFACNLSGKALQPDSCVGSCTTGQCFPTAYQQYGPAFLGMMEPTACGC